MRTFHAATVAVLLASACLGAADGPIRVPVAPPVPQPMPAPPAPDAAVRLAGDMLYVVDSDQPVIVLASPKGLVSISEEAGPIKVRGRFVGGTGLVETKTFRGKHVVTVEAVGTGRCELLVVPVGAAKEADVIRRTLDVSSGEGPIPPPKPDPKPEPKPEPKKAVAWVVIVEETAQRTPAAAKVLNDLAYWQVLKARGVNWRFYDKDAQEAKERNYDRFATETGLPAVLLLAADGERLAAFPLPATTADLDAKLKEYAK